MLFSSLVLLIGLQSQLLSLTLSLQMTQSSPSSSSSPLSSLILSSQQSNINNNNSTTSVNGGGGGVGNPVAPLQSAVLSPVASTVTTTTTNSLGSSSNLPLLSYLSASSSNNINNNNNINVNNNAPTLPPAIISTSQLIASGFPPPTNPNTNYVIRLVFNDPKNPFAYLTPLLNQTNLHEPRIELRYQSAYPYIELPENTKPNSVVAALIVNDEDSGPNGETFLSIDSGNELGNFKIVTTQHSNTIQVANPLSKNLKSDYNLTIVARDRGQPPKSSSVNLVIKLTPSTAPINSPSSFNNNESKTTWGESQIKPPDYIFCGFLLVVIFSSIIICIILICALIQKPKGKKGPLHHQSTQPLPSSRTTSSNNITRMHPSDHYPCLGLTNL